MISGSTRVLHACRPYRDPYAWYPYSGCSACLLEWIAGAVSLQCVEEQQEKWADIQALLFASAQSSRCIAPLEEAVRRWSRNNVATQGGTK